MPGVVRGLWCAWRGGVYHDNKRVYSPARYRSQQHVYMRMLPGVVGCDD